MANPFFTFVIIQTMNRQQRRIKSSKLTLENEKENTSGSDLESLLVSSIRYDQQNLISEKDGYETRSKPSQGQQSLIKKQYLSNVYIEESSESKCHCEKKIDNISQNLTLVNLKLQELESKLNLCFSKYGKMQTKTSQFQLFLEEFKHFEEDNCERVKALSSSLARMEEEHRFRTKEREEEQSRIRKSINRLENRQGDRVCLQSKMMQHKLQKFKDEQQFKMKEIVQALEKIGTLQRKMMDSPAPNPSDDSAISLDLGARKKYFRTFSVSDKARTNESTNISYSRNYQFPR